ncbi:Outer membrane receptor proteins, mostly Fe transport [Flagellimonas flava]|uniref:Outer membrane receptor proteins, mostly Fe transport n=2 Tax=Flagellimonas flava TaxID=570519 RepID=A0A1M5M581_9FLAO|nr:Outer membrane receptor proteins, mostly Fe transport [Allomuricauda flava]
MGCSFLGPAQETRTILEYDKVPLTKVLLDLEEIYKVRFSYKADLLEDKVVSLKTHEVNLQEILRVLENDTKVSIESIDDRYFIVSEAKVIFCGYLRDESDNSPIVGASIFDSNNTRGAVSDDNGFFKLEKVPGNATITISFLGYQTLEMDGKDGNQEDCPIYLMIPEFEELQEVVVREYLAKGVSKSNDGAITTNPQQQEILSGLAEPDVLQSAQLLPGIESPSETATGLYIRGGSPDQNLILWDGIKMYSSDHFFGTLSAFNPYIVKEMKVYRSGAQPEYGDRISGVLDIKLEDELPTKLKGAIGFNLTHADAQLKVPISEKVGLIVSTRRALTDVFDSPTFNRFSDKVFQNTRVRRNQEFFEPEFTNSTEEFYFFDLALKTLAQISDKDKLTLSTLLTRNKLDYSFSDVDFADNSSDLLDVENFGVNAKWEHKINNVSSLNFQSYFSSYQLGYNGVDENTAFVETVTKDNAIEEFGASMRHQWNIGKNWSLSNGYQMFNNKVDFALRVNDFTEGESASNNSHSLFQNAVFKTSKGQVQLGLRSTYYSIIKSFLVEPRAYAEQKVASNFSLKASAERRVQSISQILELATFAFGLENQVWALANGDDIPLLTSTQFTGGFLWNLGGWNLDVDAYYKNTQGLTSFTRGFQTTTLDFSEGKSKTMGVDVFLKKKWKRYSTWLGYTISDTNFEFEQLNNGNDFPGNNDIAHSLTWSHFYQWKNLQFSLGWKYRTGIPFTEATGTVTDGESTVIEYGELNAGRLPDYHRLDASLSYEFKLAKAKDVRGRLGFSLLNLYGRQNILRKDFDLFQVTDSEGNQNIILEENTRLSLGTTPNLVLRIIF